MTFFSPDVVARNATCQTTWVWEVTVTVQPVGEYRGSRGLRRRGKKRKYQESFQRDYLITVEIRKDFRGEVPIEGLLRKVFEIGISFSADIMDRIERAKEKFTLQHGFTPEEYLAIQAAVSEAKLAERKEAIEDLREKVEEILIELSKVGLSKEEERRKSMALFILLEQLELLDES